MTSAAQDTYWLSLTATLDTWEAFIPVIGAMPLILAALEDTLADATTTSAHLASLLKAV